MIFFLSFYIILMICILISVAFLTLVERKILGILHFRFGPNKLSLMGIFQPFSDAVKLFLKIFIKFKKFNFFWFVYSPIYGLILMMMFYNFFFLWGLEIVISYQLIIMFSIMSMSIYFLLGASWFSGSVYSLFGGYRSSAQAISYEVSMIFMIFVLIYYFLMVNLDYFVSYMHFFFFFFFLSFPLLMVWLIICICEANRTPFDLAESESEIVSGFNTEYSGGLFSLIFISEYGSIIFLSLISVLFVGMLNFYFLLILFLVSMVFIWVRGTFPRFRYFKLMELAWKKILFLTMYLYSIVLIL